MSSRARTRWIAAVLLGLYSIVIFRLTLLSATSEADTFVLFYRLGTRLGFTTTQTEVLGNVALFVPAGFLLAVVLGRTWASVIGCLLASICIELGQHWFLPMRVPSLADVAHNAIGGLVGALLAWPIARWARLGPRRRTQAQQASV